MVKFLKDRWEGANRLCPIKYLHLMAIGFTFGVNRQDISDILNIMVVYLAYMVSNIVVVQILSIIVYMSVFIWRKLKLWLNINS